MSGPDLRPRGFSLLEVLLALAVLALAMSALVRTASEEASSLSRAREHRYAQWVAANALAEARLARDLPASGVREGEVVMGRQRWRWRLVAAATPVAGIRRMDVSVFAEGGSEPVLTLSGFEGRR